MKEPLRAPGVRELVKKNPTALLLSPHLPRQRPNRSSRCKAEAELFLSLQQFQWFWLFFPHRVENTTPDQQEKEKQFNTYANRFLSPQHLHLFQLKTDD